MSQAFKKDGVYSSLLVGSKGLRITDTSNNLPGTLRFNSTTNQIEAYTGVDDIGGSSWQKLTTGIASSSGFGLIKIGSNLSITSSGTVSSTAIGTSRSSQKVVTVAKTSGAGDYQTINGAITYLNDLTGDDIPSSTNPYLIIVAPGEYTENITLPDYVSLSGEGYHQTIIKATTGGTSWTNNPIITIGSYSRLSNFKIDHTGGGTSYATGILISSENDLLLDNLKIVVNSSSSNPATNGVGIYVSSSTNLRFNNLIIEGSYGTNNYGIYNSSSSPIINNCDLAITNAGTSGYGIYNTSSSPVIKNTKIRVNSSTDNYGLWNNNSSPELRNLDLIADGGTSNNGYGIYNDSSDYLAETITTELNFSNQSGISSRNILTLTSGNWSTLGFENGKRIRITGASNSNNNNLFTVDQVSNSNLYLPLGSILTTESAGSSITVRSLYTLVANDSTIKGSSYSLYNNTVHYSNHLNNSYLEGGNSEDGGSEITFNNYHRITVAKEGGNFYSLGAALNSINDNTANHKYLIEVQPGVYYENSRIICKSYLKILGSGRDNTKIKFDLSGSSLDASVSCLTLASNLEISNLSFENLNTGTGTYSLLGYGLNKSNLRLHDLGIIIDASSGTITSTYGLYLSGCTSVELDNLKLVISGASANNYGLSTLSSTLEINQLDGNVTGSSSTLNYATDFNQSTVNIYNSKVEVSGSSGTNRGLMTTNNSGTEYGLQVFNSNINVTGTSAYSAYTSDNQTLVCTGCRLTGDRYFNSNDFSNSVLRCLSCWQLTGTDNLSYNPIGITGQNEGDIGSLSLGEGAGGTTSTGVHNTNIGKEAGGSNTSGFDNTFVGYQAGTGNTAGYYNSFFGSSAGSSNTSGYRNTMIGKSSGENNIDGYSNTYFGYNSGYSGTTASRNVVLGDSAAYSLTTGNDNIIGGYYAGYNLTTGGKNVLLGSGDTNKSAGYSLTNASGNVIIGYQAGYLNVSGNQSVLIGYHTGQSLLSDNNVFIGALAGYNSTIGTMNTLVGHSAGYSQTTGTYNTILGAEAGYSLTTGSYNLVAGVQAGYNLTTGQKNVLIGGSSSDGNDGAGYGITTASDNIMIGSGAGKSTTSGSDNLMMGSNAGSSNTTGNKNILIGISAGNSLLSGSRNIFMGYQAGSSNTSSDSIMIGNNAGQNSSGGYHFFMGTNAGQHLDGTENMALGYEAGKNHSGGTGTGVSNLFIGAYAGRNIQTGNYNLCLGSGTSTGGVKGTGAGLTSGSNNVLLGYLAGRLMNADYNVMIGSKAGYSNVGGDYNLFLGAEAGYSNTEGTRNLYFGYQTGYTGTTATDNVFLGHQVGYSVTTASKNILIGKGAGYSTTTKGKLLAIGTEAGYYNDSSGGIFLGYYAGRSNTTGLSNIFIGFQTGMGGIDIDQSGGTPTNLTGDYNMFIGAKAGFSVTTGSRNILLGYQSGYSTTTGGKNVMVGDNAGYSNTTGEYNLFMGSGDVGSGAGYSNTTGSQNIFMGYLAGQSNTTGSYNMCLGSQAGRNITTGQYNICAGYQAGYNMTDSSFNIYIGYDAGYQNTTGSGNICLGYYAGRSGATTTTYSNCLFIGREAGAANDADQNIFIGSQAGFKNTTGGNNLFLGTSAGKNNLTGNYNLFIGNSAGLNTTGNYNIFFGANSGSTNTTGDSNVYIGSGAGQNNQTGSNNVFIGKNAGQLTTTNSNIFFGASAGSANVIGTKNLYFGFNAGQNATGSYNLCLGGEAGATMSSSTGNMFIGYQAGFATTTGDYNFCAGYQAGYENTTGGGNMNIGYQAGYNTTTGGSNLFMGFQAGYNNVDGSKNLAIGYKSQKYITSGTSKNVALGNFSMIGNTFGSNNTAIGVNTVSVGDIGDNNIIIGPEASCVVRNTAFTQNITMGYKSNLHGFATNKSIVIGAEAMGTGAGGQYNIVLGYQTGRVLGISSSEIANTSLVEAGGTEISIGSSYIKKGQPITLIYESDLSEPETFYTTSVSGSVSTLSSAISYDFTTSDNAYLTYGSASTTISSATSGNTYLVVLTPKTDMESLFSLGDQIVLIDLSTGNNETVSIISYAIETGDTSTGTTRINIDAALTYSYTTGDVLFLARNYSSFYGDLDTSKSSGNILVGTQTATLMTTASKCIAIGDRSLVSNVTGNYNLCLGTETGNCIKSDSNVAIGSRAGYYIDNASTSSGNNTMIGFRAGYFSGYSRDSASNMILGNRCGQINDGTGNIFIGLETLTVDSYESTGTTTYDNKFALYKSTGGVPTNPIIGGDLTQNRLGVRTLTPKSTFEVSGSQGGSITTFSRTGASLGYPSNSTRYWDKAETNISGNNINGQYLTRTTLWVNGEIIYSPHSSTVTSGASTIDHDNLSRGYRGTTASHHSNQSTIYDMSVLKLEKKLIGNITSSSSTITANSTTNLNSSGILTIDSEIIYYTTAGQGLGNLNRGYSNTTTNSHTASELVYRLSSNDSELTETNLTASVSGTQTYIPINPSNFNSSGNLLIGGEILKYNDNYPHLFNVTRATNNSTGAIHTSGSVIYTLTTNINALITTTLSTNFTIADSTISLNDYSTFPTAGYLIIDQEVFQYSAVALSGVTRATSNTTNTTHSAGTGIYLLATSGTTYTTTSSLDGSINSSQTALTIDDADNFDSSGYLVIDSEIIRYTNKTVNVLQNLTRGYSNSTATNHDDSTTVRQITNVITQGTILTTNDTSTSISFSSNHGSFTSSGTALLGSELITYTGLNITGLTPNYNSLGAANHTSSTTVYGSSSIDGTNTTLNGTIDDSATTIKIISNSGFSTDGTVLIDSELITYSQGTGLINVSRGQNSTTASTHTSGTRVHNIITLGTSTANLTLDISSTDSALTIDDNSIFGSEGLILIGSEIIYYDTKDTIGGLTRGYNSTTAASHTNQTTIYNFLPSSKYVSVSDTVLSGGDCIQVSSLSGLSESGKIMIEVVNTSGSDSTFIGSEIINYASIGNSLGDISRGINSSIPDTHISGSIVYQITDNQSSTLSVSLSSDDDGIVITGSGFISNGIVRINSELISYASINKSLGIITRGYLSSTITSHTSGTTVYSIVNGSGLSLHSEYETNNLRIDDTSIIPVESVSSMDSSGFIRIEKELMHYEQKGQSLTDISRGVLSSIATTHESGTNVYHLTNNITMSLNANSNSTLDLNDDFYPTTLTSGNFTTLSSSGYFVLDREIVHYNSKGNTLVSYLSGFNGRGSYGTSAVSHTSGTTVYQVIQSGQSSYLTSSSDNSQEDFLILNSVSGFTTSGIIKIGGELIHYANSRQSLTSLTRGYSLTTATTHTSGSLVTEIESTFTQNQFLLDIDDSQTQIPLSTSGLNSSGGFLLHKRDDSNDIEIMKYDNNDAYFFDCTRGVSDTSNAEHTNGSNTIYVGSQSKTLQKGNLTYSLPYPYYIAGVRRERLSTSANPSINIGDNLIYFESNLSDSLTSTTISDTLTSGSSSVDLNDASNFSNSGYALIGNEIIQYGSKNVNTLQSLTRGLFGTSAGSFTTGQAIYEVNDGPYLLNISSISSSTSSGGINQVIEFTNNESQISSTGSLMINGEILDFNQVSQVSLTVSYDIYNYQLTNFTRGTHSTTATSHVQESATWHINNSTTTLSSTTLDDPMDGSQSTNTLTVTNLNDLNLGSDTSGYLLIESEIVYFSNVSGNIISPAYRGQYFTTATSHTSGITVYKIQKPSVIFMDTLSSGDTTGNFYPGNSLLANITQSGLILVNDEIISYGGKTCNNYGLEFKNISRGIMSTTATSHSELTLANLVNSTSTALTVSTTLAEDIDLTETSFDLTDITGFSTTSGFIIIGSEIIRYTGTSVGDNRLTGIIRGCSGTKPTTHNNGDTVFYTSITPVKVYTDSITLSGTENIQFDFGGAFGYDSSITISGIILVDSEFISYTDYIGSNPLSFNSDQNFLIDSELISFSGTTVIAKVNNSSGEHGNLGSYYNSSTTYLRHLVGSAPQKNYNFYEMSISSYTQPGTTIQLTNMYDVPMMRSDGGFFLIYKKTGTGGAALYKYSNVSSSGLISGVEMISFGNSDPYFGDSYLADKIAYLFISALLTNPSSNSYIYQLSSYDSVSHSTSSVSGINLYLSLIENLPLVGTMIGIQRDRTIWSSLSYFTMNGKVEYSTISRGITSTTPAQHTANNTIYHCSSVSPTTTLNGALSESGTDIKVADPNQFNSSGILLIDNELISYNQSHGTFMTRAQNQTSAISNTTSSGNFILFTMTSNTTTSRANITDSGNTLPMTSNSLINGLSGSVLIELSGETTEIINYQGTNSLDFLTRGNYGTTASSHSTWDSVYQIESINGYSTLRQNIDSNYDYLPLVDGSSYQNDYYGSLVLIDSEFITYYNRNTLDDLSGNQYGTATASGFINRTAFTTNVNNYSTLRFSIISGTIIIPLVSSSGYTTTSGTNYVLIDQEIITYGDTNSLDYITRGYLGTTPASYDSSDNGYILTTVTGYSTLRHNLSSTSNVLSLNDTSDYPSYGYLLIDNEYIYYSGKDSLDDLTRGEYTTTATNHSSDSIVTQLTLSGISTLRKTITDTDNYIPLETGSDYATSGSVLIDSEFINYSHKNTLDHLTRGLEGTSDQTHNTYSGTISLYLITTPRTTPNSIKLISDKVLLSDNTVGIQLDSISSFANTGTITIGSEKILFYGKQGLVDVTRATNNSTASTHNTGTNVFLLKNNTNTLTSSTLTSDMTASQTVIPLFSSSGFASSGTVVVGSEIITYSNKVGNSLSSCSRARSGTTATIHSSGNYVYQTDAIATFSNTSGNVSLTQEIIVVDDNSAFSTSGTILIDSEVMTYTNKNAITTLSRAQDGTVASSYPNGTPVILTDLSLDETHSVILANTGEGNLDIDLPAAADVTGRQYTIKKITSSGNVIINANGTELIDTTSNKTTSVQNAFITIQSDGTQWRIINYDNSSSWY